MSLRLLDIESAQPTPQICELICSQHVFALDRYARREESRLSDDIITFHFINSTALLTHALVRPRCGLEPPAWPHIPTRFATYVWG